MFGRLTSLIVSIVLLIAATWWATTGTAHAYIDIGMGSLILNGLLAAFFGSLFALKVFWGRVTLGVSTFLVRIRLRQPPRP